MKVTPEYLAGLPEWLSKLVKKTGEEDISLEKYQEHSLGWVEVSDVILLMPGWQKSKGTQRELALAKELDIPAFDFAEALPMLEQGGVMLVPPKAIRV